MHYKVEININFSSQCIRLEYKGLGAVSVETNGEGVGGGPSHGLDFLEIRVLNPCLVHYKVQININSS